MSFSLSKNQTKKQNNKNIPNINQKYPLTIIAAGHDFVFEYSEAPESVSSKQIVWGPPPPRLAHLELLGVFRNDEPQSSSARESNYTYVRDSIFNRSVRLRFAKELPQYIDHKQELDLYFRASEAIVLTNWMTGEDLEFALPAPRLSAGLEPKNLDYALFCCDMAEIANNLQNSLFSHALSQIIPFSRKAPVTLYNHLSSLYAYYLRDFMAIVDMPYENEYEFEKRIRYEALPYTFPRKETRDQLKICRPLYVNAVNHIRRLYKKAIHDYTMAYRRHLGLTREDNKVHDKYVRDVDFYAGTHRTAYFQWFYRKHDLRVFYYEDFEYNSESEADSDATAELQAPPINESEETKPPATNNDASASGSRLYNTLEEMVKKANAEAKEDESQSEEFVTAPEVNTDAQTLAKELLTEVSKPDVAPETVWTKLSNLFTTLKQSGADFLAFFTKKFSYVTGLFSDIVNGITSFFTTAKTTTQAIQYFKSIEWGYLARCLGMLCIIVISYRMQMPKVGLAVACVYYSVAFTSSGRDIVSKYMEHAINWVRPEAPRSAKFQYPTANLQDEAVQDPMDGPMLGAISMLASAGMGKFDFFQDTKTFDAFLVRLDRQNRACSAVSSMAERIGMLIKKAIGWIGGNAYGIDEELENAIPPDMANYVQEALYFFDARVIQNFKKNKHDCQRAFDLHKTHGELLFRYRQCKKLSDLLQKYSAHVARVYQLARQADPMNAKIREETVVVMFRGEAGCGKSTLVTKLNMDLMIKRGIIKKGDDPVKIRELVESQIYARNSDMGFWDGYRDQFCVVNDDFGKTVSVAGSPDLDYSELISISNIFCFPLPMAELEQKATTFFNSPLFIATTNLKAIRPPTMECHAAVQRRITCPYYVKLKDGYMVTDPRTGKKSCRDLGGKIQTDIYEFYSWDTDSGDIGTKSMSYDEVLEIIADQLERRHSKSKDMLSALVADAYASLQAPTEPTKWTSNALFMALEDWEVALCEELAGKRLHEQEMILNRYAALPRRRVYYLNTADWFALPESKKWTFAQKREHMARHCKLEFQSLEQELSIAIEKDQETIQETTTWIQNAKQFFTDNWIIRNLNWILGAIGICAGGAMALGYIQATRAYNRDVAPDFDPEYDSGDALMAQGHAYRTRDGVGKNAGRAHYANWLPSIYGASEFIVSEEQDRLGVNEKGEMVYKEEFLKDIDISEARRERCIDAAREYLAQCNAALESGKSKKERKHRKPVGPPALAQLNSWTNSNAQDVSLKLRNNLRTLSVPGTSKSMILMICGRTFVINNHVWGLLTARASLAGSKHLEFRFPRSPGKTLIPIADIVIRQATGRETDDVLIGVMPKQLVNAAPDIRKYILKREELAHVAGKDGVMIGVDDESFYTTTGSIGETKFFNAYNADFSYGADYITIRAKSTVGDCGALWMTDSSDVRRIFGIHGASEHTGVRRSLAVPIWQEMFDTAEIQAEEIDDCPLLRGNGNVLILGKVEPIYAPTRSKIVKTQIHGEIFPTTKAPAVLAAPMKPDGPFLKAAEKQFGDVPLINNTIVNRAVQDYGQMLASTMHLEEKLRKLTFEEATRGIEGSDYIRSINRQRSAGIPYAQQTTLPGKTKWFGSTTWEDNEHTAELRVIIKDQISRMEQGELVDYYFHDTLKDEIRDIAKVKQGKTRVFAAAPMDFIIIFRMYFLTFIAAMMRNRISNESAVGIRAQSMEWSRMAKHLRSKGHKIIAGDFSNYDGTLHPTILWAIYDLIEQFYFYHGETNDADRNVRRALWEAVVNSKHQAGPWQYQLNHSQPSGNPMTAILNTMYNSIVCRYAFYSIYAPEAVFTDYVAMESYGDDNVLNVSDEVPAFTQERMAEVLATIGMTYTDETKSSNLGYKTLDQVGFLKRGFKFVPDLGATLCPLEIPSILECFNWVSNPQIESEIMKQNAEMAFAELSMHPLEVFTHWSKKIVDALRHYDHTVIPLSHTAYRHMVLTGELIKLVPALEWA